MYCLDTNIAIAIFRGDEELKNKVYSINEEDIFITALTLCELYKGAYLSKQTEKSLTEINNFLLSFNILELTREACHVFGKEYARLEKTGKMTEEADLIIASIVKANEFTLITRDKKHFENTSAKLEVW